MHPALRNKVHTHSMHFQATRIGARLSDHTAKITDGTRVLAPRRRRTGNTHVRRSRELHPTPRARTRDPTNRACACHTEHATVHTRTGDADARHTRDPTGKPSRTDHGDAGRHSVHVKPHPTHGPSILQATTMRRQAVDGACRLRHTGSARARAPTDHGNGPARTGAANSNKTMHT